MNQEENNNWIRFSTGLTTVQKWSAEKKMMQQRMEEDHLAGTFEILSNFIECCNIDEKTIYNLTKIKMPSYAFVAFGYFLKIPGYSKLILRDRKLAHFILKLLLGSNDKIHQSSLCLSSMTFDTLRELLYLSFKQQNETEIDKKTKLSLSEFLTKNSILALILSILSSISHHPHTKLKPHFERKFLPDASSFYSKDASLKMYKETMEILYGHYWVKSHCFGTGYTFQQWDTQRKIMQKRLEEEHVICLLEILSSFIEYYNDSDENLNEHLNLIIEIFNDSCITNVLSSYLRNDSVLDISIHIPLYKSVLKLVQAFTYQSEFQTLISKCNIYDLIKNMKQLFDSYFKKIKFNEEEDLARFFNVLNLTYELVKKCLKSSDEILSNLDDSNDATESKENKYCEALKQFQFDSYSIVRKMENGILKADVPYYYEPLLNHPAYYYNLNRPKRLAQEAVTISNSLPISLSSTVFVRCDEERLDIMKVLITGPQDTPYANGCFEFDVFFPPDYPYSPPLINLQTTGNQTVRFNPNLYHDGKVCLSILNTWQGRPEELWNEKTSTFLQVLVSIQSLILVSQPYFNEPGYEGLIGTPAGIALSTEYDANIRQATVKWAMLEALKNPPICFKEPIRKHFLLKRKEIKKQCERWLNEMKLLIDDKQIGLSISESYIKLKLNMIQLFEELDKLKKN